MITLMTKQKISRNIPLLMLALLFFFPFQSKAITSEPSCSPPPGTIEQLAGQVNAVLSPQITPNKKATPDDANALKQPALTPVPLEQNDPHMGIRIRPNGPLNQSNPATPTGAAALPPAGGAPPPAGVNNGMTGPDSNPYFFGRPGQGTQQPAVFTPATRTLPGSN